MDDIISAVNEESIEDFLCLRVGATKTIEEITVRINEVVSIIKNKASKTPLKWLSYEEELDKVRQQKYLSIYDDVSFKYIKDIANIIFGRNVKGFQHAVFKAKDNGWAWCPKLSINADGDLKSMAGGWINFLAEDWTYIDESHQDGKIVKEKK
ncbi:hypothetical protein [Gracilibacillus sp. YIM 98692]|uniref:hypothetical protein n=1 Tax=Gracilibacillus sp. YIM 98692 TaxID=2663532 RepID=UPI00196A126F|nr:hypothetical protein [Gracilibacillus sp. YIM 98692]